jgi:HSP20 family molecular chaperone IbpA
VRGASKQRRTEHAVATTVVEPFAPGLRDLSQVLRNQGAVGAFIPPADLLVDDDGVTVYVDVPGLRSENLEVELEYDTLTVRIPKPETPRPRRIEIEADANGQREQTRTAA